MNFKNLINFACITFVLTTAASVATAVPVVVGSGVNSAGVYMEWSDGFVAEFEVSFGLISSDTVTGADLLLTLDNELADFTFAYINYGTEQDPDLFIDGITYLTHSNGGYEGDADWWHYWLKDAGEADWISSGTGMSGRIVHDGDMDGWIYGRDTAVPEPAAIAILALGAVILRKKKTQLM